MSAMPQHQIRFDSEQSPERQNWDALTVWRERVRSGARAAANLESAPGWDPYLVWLSRVKRKP